MVAFVIFRAAGQTWALPASSVAQVLRMAAPAPVPDAPAHVRGVLNVHGRLVAVIDVRARLGAGSRPPSPHDRLLLVEDGERLVALEVDEVLDVRALDASALEPAPAAGSSPLVSGALRVDDGVVLVQAPAAWVGAAETAEAR
jgi:purine-binding chemotaxis protein CheW